MRALLCFHGLLSTKADFNTILPKLNTLYDTIACYDLPGHGYNTLKFNTLNIKKFVLEAYDTLSHTHDEIDVMGYSMGGVIAAYLQSVRRVRRLVLLAPSYRYLNLKNYHFAKERSAQPNISRVLPKKNYFHIFRFAKIISDLSDDFHIIYPETLIIWGRDDYLVKEESGHLLYQMIKNENRRLIMLERHNHFNILKSPIVYEYVSSFLGY